MNNFLDQTAKNISVESTDRLAFITLEDGQPMIILVVAGFFMAVILVVPALIEAVWTECLAFYRKLTAKRHRGGCPGCNELQDDRVPYLVPDDRWDSTREGGPCALPNRKHDLEAVPDRRRDRGDPVV